MRSMILRPNMFKSELFDVQFFRTMGYTPYAAASIGECYHAAHQVKKRGEGFEAWTGAWAETAARTEEAARRFDAEGNAIGASAAFLRAWNYYRCAEAHTMPQGSEEHARLYADSLRCFDESLANAAFLAEKVAIPYEGTSLPGYFLKPRDAGERPRPTIILNGGGDGAGEELIFLCGAPHGLDYGFNVLTFHGPGHRGALNQDPRLVFRYDWEKVITPVVDYCLSRPDVDAERIGIYGVSLGGFLAPRAAASEPRLKAVAANAIIPSYFQFFLDGILERLPGILRGIAEGKASSMAAAEWDMLFASALKKDSLMKWFSSLMTWTNGTKSLGEVLVKVRGFDNMPLAPRITQAFLSMQSEGEGELSMRHAKDFFDLLPGEKRHVSLRAENGADQHCALNNVHHAAAVAYPWFRKALDAR
jgi:pimeloyl-ACP methyl ester carboxylesterase